ncbi:DNA repair protein REV1 isoform X1 [Neodiprion virginianus]|uniref:DNA repair protein REV1 isoform X1 n=2 Tax=Neodiprion virginianus TaxID=2961670 RepID=UPI001EE6977F|nr:DNA repair protein REV1 isoform X1 [Neodiprion virginianus]XP_046625866.1 DNA repair protein REV1 isoform X1 [Neodiprion virginianus]XP_046626693.1 DNA repair protein REV1 isoform X1 [Neodiprion virginianus]XP_046627519.1 DNA repair protein REV1 isoform X1 [Neodiprion virginianus]XP_046628314.1 DNA repair protein REV1 isoform X1 [Neodiprion virginianus]
MLDHTGNENMTSKRKNRDAWAPTGFEEWGGYMAAKKAKLEEQFQERAAVEFKNNSTLFQGLCIFVNGYTKPSADELRLLMMEHNGVYHHYMRPRITTHIIASNLPYSKIMMYKKSQNPLPICKPEWITDSIKAGKLLNYQDYLLYSNHTKTQPKLAFAATSAKLAPELETDKDKAILDDNSTKSKEVGPESSKPNTVSKQVSPTKEGGSRSVNSTKNPEFLSEFYNNSRLHHISTMGAVFKDYINELRDKSDKSFPGLESLKKLKRPNRTPETLDPMNSDSDEDLIDSSLDEKFAKQEPVIMHIDMDCFFVSVGLRNRPELKGLPVAVTHAKGNKAPQNASSREIEMKMYKERFKEKLNKGQKVEEKDQESSTVADKHYENASLSEIASCSYEARKAGLKNGMFLGQALKLCPDLKTIPYDFEGYKEVSYALYDIVATYTLDIEAVSCDEMYADCTKIISESGLRPLEFAEIIRKQITEKTGCPVSTGFGGNKLQARLATKKAKPNGQFYLEHKDVRRYMSTINIRDLPGVGATMTHKLNGMGVFTCAELQSVAIRELQKELGKKTGEMVYNMCRGIDNTKLNLEHVRKSVSAEVNYGIRFESTTDADKFLKQLSEEVCNRLIKANVKGRCVTLKLMIRSKNAPVETAKYMGHGICDHITRSKNLISPVNDLSIIAKEVLTLWNQLQQIPEDVRGVGIQISRLESTKSSEKSNLMAFINKTQQPGSKNKPEILSIQNVPKESKLGRLHGFLLTSKQCTPIAKSTVNSTSLASSLQSTPSISSEKKAVTTSNSVESGGSAISKENKSLRQATSSISENDNQFIDQQLRSSKPESKPNNIEDHLLMQEIDESVLAELPEEIRREITDAAKSRVVKKVKNKQEILPPIQKHPPAIPKSRENPPLIQKKQDAYFKQSKPNIEKPKKSEMPPIQEVDLAVLLELPDEIRNEILNEYRAKANESKQLAIPGCSANAINNEVRDKSPIDEANLSISQVDPDVLAALPKDIQNDVKDYCASKKLEKNTTSAQMNNKNVLIPKRFGTATSKSTVNQKATRSIKSKVSDNGKSSKTSKNKKNILVNNTKSLKKSPEPKQQVLDNDPGPAAELLKLDTPDIESKIKENATDNIMSLSMAAKSGDPEDQKALLKLLVEELMDLSLKEVKIQIQNWISESDSVNEVDFLAFTTFLSSLPKEKRIEDLHVLLKTMHRFISKSKLCVWHRAYRKTVEHVQHHMLATYDSSLMVPSIECEHVACSNGEDT